MDNVGLLSNPALCLALAMVVGVVSQAMARHLRVPGIVVLLVAGVSIGPDGLGWLWPRALGDGLGHVIGFATAIILFEGGMNLRFRELRAKAGPIRRLVTLGALITALGGTLAARVFMGWEWKVAVLFGTLVIVTGPTVVTPLLRRIRVRFSVSTVLEAEGIFIDAIGATIAICTLEVALAGDFWNSGMLGVIRRIGIGVGVGAFGGAALGALLRWRKIVPEDLTNILVVSGAVLVFETSNALSHESGITAAIVAGLMLGNSRSYALEHVIHFKEQMTVLMIGTLFVLLSADVRIDDVVALGWPGIMTVVTLSAVVRPITVFLCTRNDFNWREMAFVSWIAPRGIVAAAVASLFALEMERFGVAGGTELKALVFLVIACTVAVQGLLGGTIAKILGVKLPPRSGLVLVGANSLGLTLGQVLSKRGISVTVIDSNPSQCNDAEERGLRTVLGSVLDEFVLARARAADRSWILAMTTNETINLMAVETARDEFGVANGAVALDTRSHNVDESVVSKRSLSVWTGREIDLQTWIHRAGRGAVVILFTEVQRDDVLPQKIGPDHAVPVYVERSRRSSNRAVPFTSTTELHTGDTLLWAVDKDHLPAVEQALPAAGFSMLPPTEDIKAPAS